MNILENIEQTRCQVVAAIERWSEHVIDEFATRMHIVPLAPYAKRYVKNSIVRQGDRVSEMVRNAAMFICDENGNCDIETVTNDLMNMLKTMKPVQIPFMNGTIGEGKIKFCLPDIPIITPMLGGTTEITITEHDLEDLRRILIEEMA